MELLMRKLSKTFIPVIGFIILFSGLFFTQNKDKGKSFYTNEEVINMCDFYIDSQQEKILKAKQDSMYKDYLSRRGGLRKTLTVPPDWSWAMSPVENQNGVCWTHAVTGVIEGQLQIMHGSLIGDNGIDLDETSLPNPQSV